MRVFSSTILSLALAVTFWSGIAEAGPTPRPTPLPTITPSPLSHASVDLIWADTGTNEISNAGISSLITLRVILTSGHEGSQLGAVSVDYSGVLGALGLVEFMSTPGGPMPLLIGPTSQTGLRVENVNSGALPPYVGTGLTAAGQTHQLGTVTFRKNRVLSSTLAIRSDAKGPNDGVLDLAGNEISNFTAFNSAFICDGEGACPTPIPTPTPSPTPIATPAPAGAVVGWGRDLEGQSTPPDTVNGILGTATNIASENDHSCAIQAGTGNVVCWGVNNYGQTTPPDAVNGVLGTATDIAVGFDHSCAIQSGTGNVVCWGLDFNGQSTPPDAVNGISGTASRIAAGGHHNCAIQAGTGEVVCWGFNREGQSVPPDVVNGVSGTAAGITAGYRHSCAIQAMTGDVVCWGLDNNGQATPPNAVNGELGVASSIEAGSHHNCAIQRFTGALVCWGDNRQDQATPPDAVNGALGTAIEVAPGWSHTCAIQAGTGDVICWGSDNSGEATPPDTVNGVLGTASKVAAGRAHTLAIVADPEPTPTATPPPSSSCAEIWPPTTISTIAKGQSPANNLKVAHAITGHIVDPDSLGDTAHRIPVCAGTVVVAIVTDATGSATNTAGGSLACGSARCSGVVSTMEKYQSISQDGRDKDAITFIPK